MPFFWVTQGIPKISRLHLSSNEIFGTQSGVFEEPCEELGVAWFVLRGYSSLSALSQWVDNASAAFEGSHGATEEAIVLYFGDHDPDGWEIPRSAERNVAAIAEVRGIELPPVRFERVALVRSQIDSYDPPLSSNEIFGTQSPK